MLTLHQDLEEQLEEEESSRQRLSLDKVTLETKVKSLESEMMNAVEQKDRLCKVKLSVCPVQKTHHTIISHQPSPGVERVIFTFYSCLYKVVFI